MSKLNIITAKTAGFCFGVKRAIDLIEDEIKKGTKPLYTLGPIIHNEQVVEDLKNRGVCPIEDVSEAVGGTLVVRTHGISEKMYRQIEDYGVKYIDVTCPFVKKIHEIVSEYHKKGYTIIVTGDKEHPEVTGINGWCNDEAIVIDKAEQVRDLDKEKKYCVVSQTTFNNEEFNRISKEISEYLENAQVFSTICSATSQRQKEAAEIAAKVDTMLVFGGKSSSNTRKLYDICKLLCDNTYHINSDIIPDDVELIGTSIGITAGASTPQWIIKEAISTMEEKTKMLETSEEMSFEEALEQSLKTLRTGDVVKGTVMEVRDNEVIVNLGVKADGFIPAGEVSSDPDKKPSDVVKVGDVIDVFVVRVNDVEGNIIVSKKKLDSIKDIQEIRDAMESKAILSGKVVDIVNGGVIVLIKGTRVFVPASQASDRFMKDLEVLRGQNVELRIIDINDRKKRMVGSIKQVLVEKKAVASEKFWAEAEVGKKYTGTVKSILDFGVFVDIGGVDGLVFISELSWKRIKHPSEVCKVGDTMEVYIKDLDAEKKKISLGFKKIEDNPWVIAQSKFKVDDVIEAKVVRLVSFGAFAEMIPGVDGLIHISQIANKRIDKPADELEVGQYVTAKITEIDWDAKKISLSIRALLQAEEEEKAKDAPAEELVYSDDAEEVAEEAVEEAPADAE